MGASSSTVAGSSGPRARPRALPRRPRPGRGVPRRRRDLADLSVPDAGPASAALGGAFAAAASRAGIGPGVLVVAYGTLGGAERLWWLLRHFGHDDCAVLLGGLDAWGGPLAPARRRWSRRCSRRASGAGDTVDADELPRLGDPELRDGRHAVAGPLHGEPNPVDDPPGRIPGAMNAPGPRRSLDVPEGELVAYCGSGVTACVPLHRAFLRGREGRLYPGSWSEWSQRGLPARTRVARRGEDDRDVASTVCVPGSIATPAEVGGLRGDGSGVGGAAFRERLDLAEREAAGCGECGGLLPRVGDGRPSARRGRARRWSSFETDSGRRRPWAPAFTAASTSGPAFSIVVCRGHRGQRDIAEDLACRSRSSADRE